MNHRKSGSRVAFKEPKMCVERISKNMLKPYGIFNISSCWRDRFDGFCYFSIRFHAFCKTCFGKVWTYILNDTLASGFALFPLCFLMVLVLGERKCQYFQWFKANAGRRDETSQARAQQVRNWWNCMVSKNIVATVKYWTFGAFEVVQDVVFVKKPLDVVQKCANENEKIHKFELFLGFFFTLSPSTRCKQCATDSRLWAKDQTRPGFEPRSQWWLEEGVGAWVRRRQGLQGHSWHLFAALQTQYRNRNV